MYVSKAVTVRLDFEECGDRIRATMEISSTVSVECSREMFAERGGVSDIPEVLIEKSMNNLASLSKMRLENLGNIFSGDMAKAELAVKERLLLAMGEFQPVLTESVVIRRYDEEPEARTESGSGAQGSDGQLASVPESAACQLAACPVPAETYQHGGCRRSVDFCGRVGGERVGRVSGGRGKS